MTTPEMVPDGFIRKILDEFGMQWTHIAIFSGVGFSALGLDRYFNSGVWILGTIVAFSVVYFFRRQIPADLPRVAITAFFAVILSTVIPIVCIGANGISPLDFSAQNKTLSAAYLSLALIIPGACVISAYRQQENVYGGVYPNELTDAIRKNIADAIFYRKDQIYKVQLASLADGRIGVETELSYTLVNRTKSQQRWSGGFAVAGLNPVYSELMVDGRSMDLNRPECRTERGLRIDLNFTACQEVSLMFIATEEFPMSGSELLSSYAPATSLTLELTNNISEHIEIVVESLLPDPVEPSYSDRTVVYQSPSGILPYQGFRLYWKPVAAASATDRTES